MDTLEDKLHFLYPQQADETICTLRKIINDFKINHPTHSAKPSFSEKDVILICYADHVQEKDTKTLQTMNKFLSTYVKGYINKVHFLPFYPYSSDDGFSVIDYYQIKEEFGDWNDVKDIAKHFGLMFDLVINHISQQSEWFQKFLSGETSYEDYFISYKEPVDTSTVFRPRTHPLLTAFQTKKGKRHVWTTFSTDQIDLNFANPDVLIEMIKVLLFYVEQGATVIRLDAIAFLWKQLGTTSLHLPQTHAVVKLMRQVIDEVAPEVWFITETNVPHEDNISYFGNGHNEAHLVYNFALPPLLLYTLLKENSTYLTQWAKTLSPPTKETTFFNFTASHDGVGVTAAKKMLPPEEFNFMIDEVQKAGGKVNYRSVAGVGEVPYELNVVYLSALSDPEAFMASQTIELALQGVPAIYFNSLIGAENWQEGVEKLGYNRAINRQKFQFEELKRELADAHSVKQRIYTVYTNLLRIRTAEPLFSPNSKQEIIELSPDVFIIKRYNSEKNFILCVTNVTSKDVVLKQNFIKVTNKFIDLISESTFDITQETIPLSPYQTVWLKPL